MSETSVAPQGSHTEQTVAGESQKGDGDWASGQLGATAFAELVRVHFNWERALRRSGDPGEIERTFRTKLQDFQRREGTLMQAYWSTKRASAVALTAKPKKEGKQPLDALIERDVIIRIHRASDWFARESAIAELLHHCDTLAIRVGEVLRGTSQRIAMQWIYAIQAHLLGFVERTDGRATDAQIAEVVKSQKRELIDVEKYYGRAAEKSARIVYFRGMMQGVGLATLLALAIAALLWMSGYMKSPYLDDVQVFFASYAAGMVGAIISVMGRMGSATGKFRLDYEVGRPAVRQLGRFRPFIGAIFGVALWFLIQSGLPQVELPESGGKAFFYYGIVAFLAGFSERRANVIFGSAERTLESSLGVGAATPQATPGVDATTAGANGTATSERTTSDDEGS